MLCNDSAQRGLGHGLGDVVGHAVLEALVAIARHGVGGERDDGDGRQLEPLLRLADVLARLVPVHDGHVAVHEDDIVQQPVSRRRERARLLGGDGVAVRVEEHLEALGAIPRRRHVVPELLQHRRDHLHVELVVLDHEHVQRVGRHARLRLIGGGEREVLAHLLRLLDHLVRVVHFLELESEGEGGALSVLGRDGDVAAHQLDELLADGEPESDAERVAHAVVLDLGEHAEQLGLRRLLDANAGVGDRDGDKVVPGHLRVVRLLDELVDRESDAALDGELDRVVQEVEQHLPQPLLVAAHVDRKVGAERHVEREALVARLRVDDVERAREDLPHLERLVLELDLARLNLGDVEDVVDQVQQVLRRHDGVAHVLTRQLGQLVAHGELQHAEHAVERRPHLVRHGGEEVPLCVIGCAHLGCVELRALDVLSLGDVLADADDADDVARHVAARCRVEQQLDPASVLRDDRKLKVLAVCAEQRLAEHLRDRRRVRLVDEAALLEPETEDLLLAVAGDGGEVRVPLGDAPGLVDAQDGRVRRVDQPLQVRRQPDDLLLGVLPLGDILADTDDADRVAVGIDARRRVE
mmetsp:Transcript_48671/g.162403  ORF Transcript_48671/g.162403 Transcript_48671/m.162403 type:complete len:582 (-) Transcript_48671:242-1987(-)